MSLGVNVAVPRMIGFRHDKGERICRCYCGLVEGVTGKLVLNSDTPKLRRMGLAIYRFEGASLTRPLEVCYELREIEHRGMA